MTDNIKKSRVLVNILGIPMLIACILLGNNQVSYFPAFSILVYSIMLLSMIEWFNLSNLKTNSVKLVNFLSITIICFNLHINASLSLFLIIIMLHMLFISIIYILKSSKKPLFSISSSLFGILWIGIFIGSMIMIRNLDIGFKVTLMMFLSIWTCDTFAFFFGGRYGKRKLAPKISPNKTWFGAVSGFFGSFIVPLFFYFWFPIIEFHIFDYLICGFIFGFFGQLGDLFESLLKREANIKDTSNILQGHGGILDRFDSLSFASPVLYLYILTKCIS